MRQHQKTQSNLPPNNANIGQLGLQAAALNVQGMMNPVQRKI